MVNNASEGHNGFVKISIIGAGNVGSALGAALSRLGHDITYGVRNVADGKYRALAASGARLAAVDEAAVDCDLGIIATPWAATEAALTLAGDWGGRPLVDATNPIGPGFRLTHGHTDSGGEQVARWAVGAKVVKAFNTTGAENLRMLTYEPLRPLMPLCGDDEDACAAVAELATAMGFEAVRLGGLDQARILEPFAMVWIRMAMPLGMGREMAFALIRRRA